MYFIPRWNYVYMLLNTKSSSVISNIIITDRNFCFSYLIRFYSVLKLIQIAATDDFTQASVLSGV